MPKTSYKTGNAFNMLHKIFDLNSFDYKIFIFSSFCKNLICKGKC